jgi:hypothetical protein
MADRRGRVQQAHAIELERLRRNQAYFETQRLLQQRQMQQAALAHEIACGPSAPISSTPLYTHQPPSALRPIDDVVDRLQKILDTHQQSASTRIDQLTTTIDTLATQIGDVRKVAEEQTKHVAQFLEKGNVIHQVTCRVLGARLEKLEKMIGTSYDRDGNKSVLERLDDVSFTIEEFLERARDPEAGRMCIYFYFYCNGWLICL